MPELIVSVSGIRGLVGSSLTAEAACRFAGALGAHLGGGRVLVARDSRPSGESFKHAVIAGLMSAGCEAADIGICPTPTVGVAVKSLRAAGAIQITASHNPSPWNGLKLFGPDGAVLPPDQGTIVAELFHTGDFQRASWDGTGRVTTPPDVTGDHRQLVRDQVGVATIAASGFRVFLDGNGGAGGPLGGELLMELGCEVVRHNCDPDGHFEHDPEPTPTNLEGVSHWVKRNECHLGCALDPDADRLALLDETGACISEELTLALCVQYRLAEAVGPVVVNMSTSRVSEDLANRAGAAFYRSAVGEANVVAKMRDVDALIGGEGNGGVIDPRVGWVRDPFIGMAMVLGLMAREGKPLSQLVAELPRYAMRKTKFALPRERLPAAFDAIQKLWPDARRDTTDGLRLDGPDWWLHVRSSNTEPVVRVIAESPNAEQTADLCERARIAVAD